MPSEPILRIALPGPFRGLFDYLPPVDCLSPPQPGSRLTVPFGRSKRCGILVELSDFSELPPDRLKRAESLVDPTPLLSEENLNFLQWAARYYQHPLGDVIFHALPVRLRGARKPASGRIRGWRLTQTGQAIDVSLLRRAPRQAGVLQYLREHPGDCEEAQLFEYLGNCTSVLRNLQLKGWLEPVEIRAIAQRRPTKLQALKLNDFQARAIEEITGRSNRFGVFLLDGVTGSGKTEVYLNLIEQVVDQAGQVLVLVPEIGLTPQLVWRFERRLGLPVTRLHSSLSEGERERAWLSAGRGEASILVGTRSSIFTPLPKLKLIIVDEEHDLSFKQQEGFRYSARDLAIVRAQRQNCPVVLGTATPSLESLYNAQQGRYTLIRLPERVGGAIPPRINLLDIRSSRLDGGVSPALFKRIHEVLRQGDQVMLFLNRRGYAPLITCHACGWLAECPRCDARMTLHLKSHMLWCHHCGHQQKPPASCPSCGSPDIRSLGQGTERLETVLQQQFPDVPVARIDRDSTSRKGSLEKLLRAVGAGDFPIIIGTQMLAKGHHFPNVTLVGLIDVDQGLFGVDYRASERMAQLITQVAGRAGREEKPGLVLIQTRHPEHPLLELLVHQGYGAFAEEALKERHLAHLPPFSYQVLLRAESSKAQAPVTFLNAATAAGRQLSSPVEIEFWGPVPAPMEKKAGMIRAHLLVQVSDRKQLQNWLDRWVQELSRLPEVNRVRWSIDVDPQEMT